MNLLHVQLLGFTGATARRLLLSALVLLGIVIVRYLFVWTVQLATGKSENERTVFWTRQGASLITAILIVVALVSIWFKDAGHLATIAVGDDSVWVHARQYTGRLVTVTNDKVFDTPVYTYTREFPFIWEEVKIPIVISSNRSVNWRERRRSA